MLCREMGFISPEPYSDWKSPAYFRRMGTAGGKAEECAGKGRFPFLDREDPDTMPSEGLESRINVLNHLVLFCRVICENTLKIYNITVAAWVWGM